MKIIKDKVTVDRLTMTSGLATQSTVKLWECIEDKTESGVWWFWPAEHDEQGAMVHVGSIMVFGGPVSDGYGGRTLDFPTRSGVVKIQGPWHSNTDALYEKTGVDLRDKHRTKGVIALKRQFDGNDTILADVVWADPDEGTIGTFDRIDVLAQQMANGNNTPVYYYRKSSSGSSCGPMYPKDWTDKQKSEFHSKERR